MLRGAKTKTALIGCGASVRAMRGVFTHPPGGIPLPILHSACNSLPPAYVCNSQPYRAVSMTLQYPRRSLRAQLLTQPFDFDEGKVVVLNVGQYL